MKAFRKFVLLMVLPLMAFTAHKFYVSVTQVTYSEKDRTLQVTSRVFIDDMDLVLKERYGIAVKLGTEDEDKDIANPLLEKYLRAKFLIRINEEEAGYKFLGKRYDNDILVCYMEIPVPALKDIHSLEIQNELLTDLFEDQKNIVHIDLDNRKESFVLVRDNNKAVLNL